MTCKELCDSLKTAILTVKAVTFSRNSRNSFYGSCFAFYLTLRSLRLLPFNRVRPSFSELLLCTDKQLVRTFSKRLRSDFHSQYHVVGYADFFSYQLCHRSNSTLRHVRSQKGRQRGWSWSAGCGRTSAFTGAAAGCIERARCATSGILQHSGLGGGLLHGYSVNTVGRRSCESVCQWNCRRFENTWNNGTSSFEHSEVSSRRGTVRTSKIEIPSFFHQKPFPKTWLKIRGVRLVNFSLHFQSRYENFLYFLCFQLYFKSSWNIFKMNFQGTKTNGWHVLLVKSAILHPLVWQDICLGFRMRMLWCLLPGALINHLRMIMKLVRKCINEIMSYNRTDNMVPRWFLTSPNYLPAGPVFSHLIVDRWLLCKMNFN